MSKISDILASGVGGVLPTMMARQYNKDRAAEEAAAEAAKAASVGNVGTAGNVGTVTKMKKGGVTRADGCITKGHTRGKMV
jgi:uncharacterized protein (UPF0333 family)